MSTEPRLASLGIQEVDLTNPRYLSMAEAKERRRQEGRTDHQFVVMPVYALADPEQALDDMTLGVENLLGFTPIHCLWCGREYRRPEDKTAVCHGA